MKKSGSITVFTSLFLAVFLLVFQVLLQSVQIGGGRVQAETGVEEGRIRYLPGMTGNCWKGIMFLWWMEVMEPECGSRSVCIKR